MPADILISPLPWEEYAVIRALSAYASEHGVASFLIAGTDPVGGSRLTSVPARDLADGQEGWALDAASAIRLPWRPDIAWVAADRTEGCVVPTPRYVLKQMVAVAAGRGLRVRTGVEPEFFLLAADGSTISDPWDTAMRPCYDQQALMRRYDVVAEICDHMQALGWKPYQADHEDANGQFEINWEYEDALVTADRHAFFKLMVESVADRYGIRATFLPKPFPHLTGNGCHCHVSVWNAAGTENVFGDPAMRFGLSVRGRHFLGGILRHAPALAALTNPTVNSYERLAAPRPVSGATWAPYAVTWAGNNRTHLVRVPGPGRFELRLPDGATDPWLLQAAVIAAGLDGLATNADPGPHSDVDMNRDSLVAMAAPPLPSSLSDALGALAADDALQDLLGRDFVAAYLERKLGECDRPRVDPAACGCKTSRDV